jgi:hypothetical protein
MPGESIFSDLLGLTIARPDAGDAFEAAIDTSHVRVKHFGDEPRASLSHLSLPVHGAWLNSPGPPLPGLPTGQSRLSGRAYLSHPRGG